MIRSPICTVLGHVDHGKSSILDYIRGSAIVATEAGAITQSIGASIIPLETIKKKCGELLAGKAFTIPGLLFIDTPGHAAFTSLRKRGGSLADIAIVVIDINEGFKPQTKEAIAILKNSKTPFIVAANKIDLIPGWRANTEKFLLKQLSSQNEDVVAKVEEKLYALVGSLSSEFNLPSERFDRVDDFTKQVAIVPCSAKTGVGIPELLMAVAGLAQKYLESCLTCNAAGPAKGIILEVKEAVGIGKCIDVILYDGTLHVGDTIVIAGIDSPIVTKAKALLEPAPLAEMRDKKTKYVSVKEVTAAIGVKISAPELESVIPGMPIRSIGESSIDSVKEELMQEINESAMEMDPEGIIIKADTLGSLEALHKLLKEKEISIMKASIGNITKKDIADAEANYANNPFSAIILGFNVANTIPNPPETVRVLTDNVIYKLIGMYEELQVELHRKEEAKALDKLVKPYKLQVLKGYVFRQSNPAIVGIEVLAGTATAGSQVMNEEGHAITSIKSMQREKENVTSAQKGDKLAMSFEGVTVGRQIVEEQVLYSSVPEEDFRQMKELKQYLSSDEKEVLRQVAEIKRRENPVWGV